MVLSQLLYVSLFIPDSALLMLDVVDNGGGHIQCCP